MEIVTWTGLFTGATVTDDQALGNGRLVPDGEVKSTTYRRLGELAWPDPLTGFLRLVCVHVRS